MTDKREAPRQPGDSSHGDEPAKNIKDLDADPKEMDKVKGGRRRTEDPCAGGEGTPRRG